MAASRRMRIVRWVVAALLVLVLAVVATGLLLLDSRWGAERVRRLIVDRANGALAATLSVESLGGSFLGGDMRLTGVRLTKDGVEVFAADDVRIRYSLGQLMSGITIADVALTRPRITAVQDPATGAWNLARLTRGGGGGQGPTFRIDRVRIRDGHVEVRPADAQPRDLDALQAVLGLATSRGRWDIAVQSLSGRDPATGLALSNVATDLTVVNGDITADDLSATTALSEIVGRVAYRAPDGSAGGPRRLEFDVETRPLAIRDLRDYVPALASYPESTRVDTHVTGTLDAFAADWEMSSEAGAAAGHLTGGLSADVLTLDGSVTTRRFDAVTWFGSDALPPLVDATGTYALTLPLGETDRLQVTFDASMPSARIADLDLRSIRVRGKYAEGAVEGRGSARAYGASVVGTGEWRRSTAAYRATGTFKDLDLSRLPRHLSAPVLHSSLNGEAAVSGDGATWNVDATLGPSEIEGATVAEGFTASASRRAGTLAYRAAGSVTGLDPSRLTALVTDPPELWRRATGAVDADLTVEGTGDSWDAMAVDADMRVHQATLPGLALRQSVIGVVIAARTLTLDLTTPDVSLSTDPLGYATGDLTATGSAVVHLRIPEATEPFTLEKMDGRADVTVANLAARGVRASSGHLQGRLSRGALDLDDLVLSGPELDVKATGVIAVEGTRESNLQWEVVANDLGVVRPWLGRELSGSGRAEGTVTGRSASPRIQGTMQAHELKSESVAALTVTTTFASDMPDWNWHDAAGTAHASAAFVQVTGTAIDEVTADVQFDRGTFDVTASLAQGSRDVSIGARVLPHPDHHEVHLRRAVFTMEQHAWQLPDGQEAVVQYAPERIGIEGLILQSGSSRLTVEGALGQGAETPLTVVASGVAVRDLSEMALSPRDVGGRLDGTATVTGSFDAPVVASRLVIADGMVEGLQFSTMSATIGYERHRLAIDMALDAGTLGSLTAVGSLPLGSAAAGEAGGREPYDLSVKSTAIDVGFFQPLTSLVDQLRGTAEIEARVSGPAGAPSLDGHVTLSNGTFRVPATGVTYSEVQADLVLNGQHMDVRQSRFVDPDGHAATLSGTLGVPGLTDDRSFEVLIRADELHVLNNEFGEVAVTTDLQALGSLSAPLVSGTIRVVRGRLEVSDLLDRLNAGGYQAVATDTDAPASADPYSQSSLSITLAMPGNVVVRGRDLRTRGGGPVGFGDVNVTVGGALSIAKEPGQPATVLGQVDVVRGQYQFQGLPFTIVRGSSLQFQGAPSNPTLDVTAERVISGVTASVRLRGTLDRPQIDLSSDPPLDEGDVLSLIVFNQTMNALPGGQRVSLAARAGALAAGAIATPLADSVARALNLDLFEIRPTENVGGASVRIGQQVSDRLFLGFSQDFGREEVSQLTFEYRLNEIISIVTSIAHGTGADYSRRAQQAGIDLIFMLR